jgi:hypothetical protein
VAIVLPMFLANPHPPMGEVIARGGHDELA